MSKEEIEDILEELHLVRPEILAPKAKKLFEAIMSIADERDKFQQENQELKSQLAGTTHCFDEEEHRKLKKQLEKLQEEYIDFQEKASDIQFELRDDRDNYYERLQDKYREQKEFIEWLEAMSIMYENEYKDIDVAEHYNCVLLKYKEIIGGIK